MGAADDTVMTSIHALREAGRVVGVATLSLAAVESEEFGRCATIERAIAAPNADAGSRRRLLDGAAAVAHEAGLSWRDHLRRFR